MTFDELLEQVIALLKRQGRVSYGAMKRRFELDDAYLEDLKIELIEAQGLAEDENGRILVWIGAGDAAESASQSDQATQPNAQATSSTQQVESPLTEPRTPEAERRQLTVMFCDLVESTQLSGRLDPEDLREVVREYQQVCSEVIQRYDGHVAQLLGDGLLVYFGYPQAHEDDAQRAVRTGLGIVETIGTLNTHLERDQGIKLAVRLGIHTGLVVVGEMGGGDRQEQLALGETPNLAARIQGLAEPDTLLVSDATYRLIQGYFDCAALGEHDLKGVSQPLAVYSVLGDRGIQSRLDVAAVRGLTPLVGREQEVGLLLERWEQAKEGQGQVILLSGEAGIGKSRLVQVLKDHVADAPHTRFECRSSPYYQNTALYPMTDLLQRTLRWHQDDTPEERLGKLEQALGQYRMPLAETVPLLAPLLSLTIPEDRYPPLVLSPQRQRQQTLETLVAMLVELSEQQHLIFILEDLHWADPTTLELLDLLIDQTPTAAICVLLTYRPEFQPPWSHRSYLTAVTVHRLSPTQVGQIVTRLTGGKRLPAEVLRQIIDKTDGVPLYVEETMKAVLESGVLQEGDEQYELTGAFASLAIPATLQDSLMARLDRLASAKAVAQYASVIGRQFSYELLQAVSQLDKTMLQHELGKLVEAELVYQRGLPPQAVYVFKHALVQDAAYASLLKATRQQYHQRIAQVLAERFPETAEAQPELLAQHLTEAGLNEQAARYWHTAGQRANERWAYVEAIAHFTTGLALIATLPDTTERALHELHGQIALGQACVATKGVASPDVEHVYSRAWELCQQVGDSTQRFAVLRVLWNYALARAQLRQARALGEQLLSVAQRQHDPALLQAAHRALGSTLFYLGAFVTAQTHCAHGLALDDPRQRPSAAFLAGEYADVMCLCYDGWSLWVLGSLRQSLQKSHEALTRAEALAHPYSRVFALVMLAMLSHYRQEIPVTYERAEAVITLSREQGFPQWFAAGTILRGWARARQGSAEEGLTQIRQGLAAWRGTGAEGVVPYYLALFAEVYGTRGHHQQGLTVLAEAIGLVDTTGERCWEAELYRLKGALLLQQSSDNAQQAETCFHKALDVARSQQAKSWELRAATSLARLWQQQGKRDEARELLGDVYDWFTEGFDTADLKEARVLLDELA